MKLSVRKLFAFACLFSAVVFNGCSSPSQGPVFSDNPKPRMDTRPSAGGSKTRPPQDVAVARFRIGETVIVDFSGSPIVIEPLEGPITEDGNITLPLIGPVTAAGLTAGELQNEIYTNYVPKYYVRLTVTIKSGDRVYYVGGEVKGAGRELYVGDTTVTKAIQSAGGLTDFANHGRVWLTRATTGQRIRVNYDKALEDPSKDPPVYPDDQVNVEKRLF